MSADATFTIIQDSREKKPWCFSATGSIDNVEVAKLDTGDYSIKGFEKSFMIERKASVDELFVNLGVQWARFEREMERAKPYKYKYLVIEASLSQIYQGSNYSKMSGRFIMARLLYIMFKYGVVPLFIGKSQNTEMFIVQLMKMAIHEEGICQ
ncbi:MAG: ERCC4 domain-containing protein [Nitrososphaera sp.]|nr:ERCC4 domain-containing protein [Nitrososphaera sp.]